MREVGFSPPDVVAGLVAEMADCQIEGVEKADDDQPEDDLGGNALLFDDFFVEAFVFFVRHVCSYV
jgi:hypothetical protein